MVNYGNSKALVAVNDPQVNSGQLSSAPILNSGPQERPSNPAGGPGRVRNAWGEAGTVLQGQPLAIEYNHAVL